MKLLSTKQAATALGISLPRIHQLIQEGKLEAQKIGRDYAIEESALEAVQTYGKAGRPPKSKEANGKTRTTTKTLARGQKRAKKGINK